MNNRMKTFTPQKAYLLIGLALIAQYLVSALASNLIFMPYADPEKLQNLVKIISPTGFLLLMYVPRVIGVIVFWLIARIVPFERKAGSKIGFGSIMQLFFIMYAVSSVFNAIGTGIKMLSPADAASQTDQLSDIIATGNIGGFVIVLMLAPIFEEIVFRKLILDRVSKYGEANAILFSAICFGLFHENLSQSLYTFCIGLALGYVYIKTRNVFITMLMHFTYNLLGTSVMYVLPMMNKGNVSPLLVGVIALIAINTLALNVLGIIFLVNWIRKKKFVTDDTSENCIKKKDVFKTIYLRPTVIIFFAMCLFSIVSELLNIRLF